MVTKQTKKCNKCNQFKDSTEFSKRPGNKLNSWCRVCHAVYDRERRLSKNPNTKAYITQKEGDIKKICSKCGIEKNRSEFNINHKRKGFMVSQCKECKAKITRERTLRKNPNAKSIIKRDKNSLTRICTKCREVKPTLEFNKRDAIGNLDYYCSRCRANYHLKRRSSIRSNK